MEIDKPKLLNNKLKIFGVLLFTLMFTLGLFGTAYAKVARDVFPTKLKPKNNVYVYYYGNWDVDGGSKDKPIETKSLEWYYRGSLVERPEAYFRASYDGDYKTSATGKNESPTLQVDVGGKVTFNDASSTHNGYGLDWSRTDFQIHDSSGKVIHEGRMCDSYTFTKADTYDVYYNVYDDTPDSHTLGWGNYGNNGNKRGQVRAFKEVYGTFYYTHLKIQVSESKQGVQVFHMYWDGSEWDNDYDRTYEMQPGETKTFEYDEDVGEIYLGMEFGESPDDIIGLEADDLRSSTQITLTINRNQRVYIAFCYMDEPETSDGDLPEPDEDALESTGGGSTNSGKREITVNIELEATLIYPGVDDNITDTFYLEPVTLYCNSTSKDHFSRNEINFERAQEINDDGKATDVTDEARGCVVYATPSIKYTGPEFKTSNARCYDLDGDCTIASGTVKKNDYGSTINKVNIYCLEDEDFDITLYYVCSLKYQGSMPGDEPEIPDEPLPEDEIETDPKLDSEPPLTEPPTVSTSVTVTSTGTSMNYMTFGGTIKNTASSSASSSDGKWTNPNNGATKTINGAIDKHVTTLGIQSNDIDGYTGTQYYNESTKYPNNKSSSGSITLSTPIKGEDVGYILQGVRGQSSQFSFMAYGTSNAVVDYTTWDENNASKNLSMSTTATHKDNDVVKLTNKTPTVSIANIQTTMDHWIDKYGVRQEYPTPHTKTTKHYNKSPLNIDITFNDPEKDICYSVVYIGEGKTVGENLRYVSTHGVNPGTGESMENEQDGNVGILFDLEKTVDSLDGGFHATLTPLREGDYWIQSYIYDAKSLPIGGIIEQSNIAEKVFTVIGEPMQPTADITEPTFAYALEEVDFLQASTDPNGVEDITKYVYSFPDVATSKPTPSSPAGMKGGKIKFPAPTKTGGREYELKLKVTDTTNLSDEDTIKVKVIDQIPIALLEITDNEDNADDRTRVKENRKITITAKNSSYPKSSPILWNECIWEVKPMGGGAKKEYVNWDDANTDGNKQRVLQFDKPGKYRVSVQLVSNYSKNNPNSPDIAAAKSYIDITVYQDKPPVIDVGVTSEKPNFVDNPESVTTVFHMETSSSDDLVNLPSGVQWKVYEDLNDDGKITDDETLPSSSYTIDAQHKTVKVVTKFQEGAHNFIKAVATATETFGQPFIEKLLPPDGSWKRTATSFETHTINWPPVLELIPDQGPNTIPNNQFNPNPGTPYEPTDLNGDKMPDGMFIKAYTDDIFSLKTKIKDELPALATMTWELQKQNHSGTYDKTDDMGRRWIQSNKVSHTLGHDGGTMRIDSPGIYKLIGTVTDDCGETDTKYIYIRVYTLPKAVLDSNPVYRKGGMWNTKENIRFDLRATNSVVDDEWGVAWHRIDWSKDNWDVIPKDGQDTKEIHFMNPEYTARYNDQIQGDNMFSGRNSPIGFGEFDTDVVELIVMPGLYGHWGEDVGVNDQQLTPAYRNELYASVETLANKIRNLSPYIIVNIVKAPAFEDEIKEKPYETGFFSAFLGDANSSGNKYLVPGKNENEFLDANHTKGTSFIEGDLDLMIADGATNGWVDVQDAYNVNVPDSYNNLPFDNGSIKVYLSVYKEEASGPVYSINKTLIASGSCEADLEKVVTMKRKETDTGWTLTTANGQKYTNINGRIRIDIEFQGQSDDANIIMMAKGWAGGLDAYYRTEEISPIQALSKVTTNPNAYRFLIYATNNVDAEIFKCNIDISTNQWYQEYASMLEREGFYSANIGVDAYMVDQDGNKIEDRNHTAYFEDLSSRLNKNGETKHIYTTTGYNQLFVQYTMYDWIRSIVPIRENNQYRSLSFTEPGTYDFKYWGTNYGNKVTTPLTVNIAVEPDLPPRIEGEVLPKFYRDPTDGNRATIALLGPYSDVVRRQALTVISDDDDYIDFTEITVTYDANNNKVFTDTTDTKWYMEEGGTNYNGMEYIFERLQ